jgi:hypothetical protein
VVYEGLRVPLVLPQHPLPAPPEASILLAVDQELSEGATLRVAPELSDPVGSLEVREHQDVEELGAGSGTKGPLRRLQPAFEIVGSHLSRSLRLRSRSKAKRAALSRK